MPALWTVATALAVYLLALLTIGWRADRAVGPWVSDRFRPALHGLSLATLCSAWTYFGAVGDASRGSWLFLANALGPIIAITLGYSVWRRIAVLAKQENVGSLADFLAARYAKSRALGVLVTAVAVLGVLPYIALQLAVLSKAWRFVSGANGQDGWLAGGFTAVLAGIAILFGARRPSLTQHNRGLVGILALESAVKLAGLVSVAGLVIALFLKTHDELSLAYHAIPNVSAGIGGSFATLVMLCTVTAFTLPRQFHLSFVAIEKVDDSRTASWIVPAYFCLWALATLIIAVGIRTGLGAAMADAQMQVLAVPSLHGHPWIVLIALLGGLSAGAAMVVVELTAISAMVSNEIVLPLLAGGLRNRSGESDVGRSIVRVRRGTIIGMAAMAWLYFVSIRSVEEPTQLGLTALTAFAQLTPSLIGGIYWRRAQSSGAIVGIIAGMVVWAVAIAAPAFHGSMDQVGVPAISTLWSTSGTGINFAIWLSLVVNCALFFVVSARKAPRLIDTIQANSFVLAPDPVLSRDGPYIKATISDLRTLLSQFLGSAEADKFLREFASDARRATLSDSDPISPTIARSAERLLAGVIGASSARNVVAIAISAESQDAREISRILDEAGHAVHFNRELLQTTLDSLPQAVSVFDRNLALVAWNAAFLRLLALPADDVHIGKSVLDLVREHAHSGEASIMRERLLDCAQAARAGSLIEVEHLVGEARVVHFSGRPLGSRDYLFTIADVSELRAAEQVLTRSKAELELLIEERTEELVSTNLALAEAKQTAEQATGAQRRFVAAASHDLVQPLHAARLFIGNALVGTDDRDPSAKLLRKADQAVEGAHRLLHALLNLSRLEIGALKPKLETIDAGALLGSLEEEFAPQAEIRGLELAVLPTKHWIRSDTDLLRAMLQNLVLNALRYTPAGRVVVCARRAGNAVRIEVRDTGVGIATDKLLSAFAEFSRLDEGRSLAAGAGLGLSIVARIADVLGHKVSVRSTPGEGSVFSILLPAAKPARQRFIPTNTVVSLEGLRVLCVDDERDVLLGTSALIERWGATVDAAGSCGEALAFDGSWDVVLADYHLGDGTGLTLLRELATRARVKLLVTATPEPDWGEQIERENIRCLAKPIAPLELQAILAAEVPTQTVAGRSRDMAVS